MDNEITRRLKMLAGSGSFGDVAKLLELLSKQAADATTPIPGITAAEDSLVTRRAIHNYLQSAIDRMRHIKDNAGSTQSSQDTDDLE